MKHPDPNTSATIPMRQLALFAIASLGLFIFARAAYPLVSDDWTVFQTALPLVVAGSGLTLLIGRRLRRTPSTHPAGHAVVEWAIVVIFVFVALIPFSVGLTQVINGLFDRSPAAARVVEVVRKTEAYSPRGQPARCVEVAPDRAGQASTLQEICVVPFSRSVFPVRVWRTLQPGDRLQLYTQAGALGLERLLGVERLPDS